ncbi:MAG: hypothetical protein A3K19_04755 [Lentisphaerae bacterium RIFOXYB12_FULL_65_16]|nr:MAG: hypothetical protein A3K18_11495 [Lentisphaerae bacterium RIFOXYA12_64_32]OGV84041.1 MAG: hypothetical protein A3K19_04755 [Lentisphaerae bacterium RIFOXYB12_FULL_65_16]
MLTAVLGLALGCLAQDARQAQGQALLDEIRNALEVKPTTAPAAACTLSEVKTGAHRAHGTKPFDYNRSLALRNPQITYNLKYWMNTGTAAGEDPLAIEGSSGLGMDRPSGANWYSNNFFEFEYGGKPILKTALATFEVLSADGPTASARVAWDTPAATVTLNVELEGAGDFLRLQCTVTAKGAPEDVTIGFRAYPGHTAAPRARRAATCRRELTAPQKLTLGADEATVLLFDEFDPATSCALSFATASVRDGTLDLGEYGVTLSFRFPAAPVVKTGAFKLWDLDGVTLNTAMTRVLGNAEQGK